MYVTAGGDAVVQSLGDNGMPGGNTDFESQLSRHKTITMKLALLKSQAAMNFAGNVIFFARGCGQMVMWSVVDAYGCLGLHTNGRKGSTWVNKTKEAWAADMLQVFGISELVDSTFATHNSIKEDVLSWSNRCCAHPSVSTAGLLLLLVRFTCTNHKNLGRLCHVDPRGPSICTAEICACRLGALDHSHSHGQELPLAPSKATDIRAAGSTDGAAAGCWRVF